MAKFKKKKRWHDEQKYYSMIISAHLNILRNIREKYEPAFLLNNW